MSIEFVSNLIRKQTSKLEKIKQSLLNQNDKTRLNVPILNAITELEILSCRVGLNTVAIFCDLFFRV